MSNPEYAGNFPADRRQILSSAEIVRKAEERLQQLGPGPYTPQQQDVHNKLQEVLRKYRGLAPSPSNAMRSEPIVIDGPGDVYSDSQSILNFTGTSNYQPPPNPHTSNLSTTFVSNASTTSPTAFTPGVQYVPYEQYSSSHLSAAAPVSYPYRPAIGVQQVIKSGTHFAQVSNSSTAMRFSAVDQPSANVANAQIKDATSSAVSNSTSNSEVSLNCSLSSSWPQLNTIPAFEARSFDQLIHDTDAQLQLEEELEDAFVQLADDFIEQTLEYAVRIAKHRGSTTIETNDMLIALDRYAMQPVVSLPQLGLPSTTSKRRADAEAHRQRLALINKKLKKF